jgi:leucyl aminopeptidase
VPTVEVVTTPLAEDDAAMVAVAVFAPASGERTDAPELAPAAVAIAEAAGIDLVAELQAASFDAAPGSLLRVPTRGSIASPTIAVVGLGPAADVRADSLRRAAATVANAAERLEVVALDLVDVAGVDAVGDLDAVTATQAVAEGIHLGAYRFGSYRSEAPAFALEQVRLHVAGDAVDAARSAVEVAAVTAAATCLARDLVNIPPQDKRPPALADRAVAEVADLPITARVLDEDALLDGGYGGILGVGQGSSEPPRLVELTYAPDGAERHVVLVGKGITFDTGGISLKPSVSMETMKSDMAGAATVLATIKAAAQLQLPVKVTVLLALAENMPSGTATRVSDVLTMKGGTTVEVINTDAEGRLVLGDALVHASELEPDAIVDVATLTGSIVVALGDRIGGLMASDDALADALLAAGTAAGEPLWRLPLAGAQYGDRVEGAIADLKNTGGREAGSIFAALFLQRFVGEGLAWAHLDIAGVAWTNNAEGYQSKGATGNPVRTLIDWLRA